MILKHNFSAKALAKLKNQRINQKKKIKEDREATEYNTMKEEDYVGYIDAIQPAVDELLLPEKKMIKTKWAYVQDYFLNLCIGISISLFGLAAYVAWFK